MPQANSLLPLDPEVEKQVRASSVLHECQQLVGCPFLCYLQKIVISHEPLSYTVSLYGHPGIGIVFTPASFTFEPFETVIY
jgi:hypothetical protein